MPSAVQGDQSRASLSIVAVIGLAALAVPRAVVHDLGLITSGPINTVLVFAPPLIWLAVVLAHRVTRVFTTLLTVGFVYGSLLAVVHQILWFAAFGAQSPALGGNLAGVLPAGTEALVLRAFSVVSSISTGLVVGAITGAVAVCLRSVQHGRRARVPSANDRAPR